jgi:curved DNA-binding protein
MPDNYDDPMPGTDPFAGGEHFAGSDFDDLLGALFGGRSGGLGGFGRRTRVSAPGADAEAELELPLADAYTGGRRRITLQTAAGTRHFEVTIPPGALDGQRIRLAGEGGAGLSGGPRGDLYLVVRLAPHPRFRVDGRDITVELPVAPWEAALGASVPVDTPGGPVQVQVPPGSSSGRRLRLRGRGLPNATGAPGDLYAEVKIAVPPQPTDAERDLWRRLAAASTFEPRIRIAGDQRPG